MRQIWFGNVAHAQWVPCPLTGMTRQREKRSTELALDNGGLVIDNSYANHSFYEIDLPIGPSAGYNGIEAFPAFDSGEWGTDFLRFVDPVRQSENLFTENWASPGLAELGWKGVYDSTASPTFGNVAAAATSSYQKPLRNCTFSWTATAANALPVQRASTFTFLIPPTMTAWIGASGSATGTAVVQVQPINLDGSLAAVVNVTLSAETAAPALSASFSGATYKAIKVYVTATATGASSITLNSMWAQILLTGQTPILNRHIPGKGHAGLRFRGTARVETYRVVQQGATAAAQALVGASIVLAEVEPWTP